MLGAWWLRVWLLALAFLAVAGVRAVQLGIPLRDPHGSIFVSRVGITVGLMLVIAVADAVRRTPAGRRDRAGVLAVLRQRWTRRRVGLAAAGLFAYHLVYFAYHNLKSWDALNRPRDAMLERWDRALFAGHTPAVLLHDLLGTHVAMVVLTGWYESFSAVFAVAVAAALVLPIRIRTTYLFLAGAMWVWILGVGSYYLIPSLGPFHQMPQAFAGLSRTVVQHTQGTYLAQRDALLADPRAPGRFAQISAFASLHTALTTYLALMAARLGLRRLAILGWVFVAGTVVATVYLGWHYVVDDVAGLLIAVLGVGLGQLTVRPAEDDDGAKIVLGEDDRRSPAEQDRGRSGRGRRDRPPAP